MPLMWTFQTSSREDMNVLPRFGPIRCHREDMWKINIKNYYVRKSSQCVRTHVIFTCARNTFACTRCRSESVGDILRIMLDDGLLIKDIAVAVR